MYTKKTNLANAMITPFLKDFVIFYGLAEMPNMGTLNRHERLRFEDNSHSLNIEIFENFYFTYVKLNSCI